MARKQIIKKKNPLIVIGAEGGNKTEKIYFSNFKERTLRIQFSTGNKTDPEGMLEDLLKYIQNEDIKSEDECTIFLVIDTDLDPKRIEKIKKIKPICDKNNIILITSSPTFEIWYLMHYDKNIKIFTSSLEVKKSMVKHIPKYTESMNVFPKIIDKLDKAYKQAQKIEMLAEKEKEDKIDTNPHTDVYKIIDKINEYKNNLN